jgi:hypothetical protein
LLSRFGGQLPIESDPRIGNRVIFGRHIRRNPSPLTGVSKTYRRAAYKGPTTDISLIAMPE